MLIAQSHHEEQKLIARNVVAELAPLWLILDFNDLKGTTAPWLKTVRPVIEKWYITSQYVAAQFVKNYRNAVLSAAEPLNVDVPNPFGLFGSPVQAPRDVQLRIMASMQVTGPGWVMGKSVPGMSPGSETELMGRGFSKSVGAATRLTLNGGRGMVRALLDIDQDAKGIIAVADEDSCSSCIQLASMKLFKGFNTSKQLDAVAVGHDFCLCSAQLLY